MVSKRDNNQNSKIVVDKNGNKWVKPVCPRCGRMVVVYRSRTDDFRCRQCKMLFKWDNNGEEKR